MTHEHWFFDNSGNTGGVIAIVGYDGKCKMPEGKQRCLERTTRLLFQCQAKGFIIFSKYDEACLYSQRPVYYDLMREYVAAGSENPNTRIYIGEDPSMLHDWLRFIIDCQELQAMSFQNRLRNDVYAWLFNRRTFLLKGRLSIWSFFGLLQLNRLCMF